MRQITFAVVCLASLLSQGCKMFQPDSPLNVNRGVAHDEYDAAAKEARGNTEPEKRVDGLGDWLYSPEAKQINAHLGVAN